MIRIQIICAENLPVPTKVERKTKIICFSSSTCDYFIGSFKNGENSRNPRFNCSFDVDLFRCIYLSFKLYSSRLFSDDIFLGDVFINFSTFLQKPPGEEIFKRTTESAQFNFPLTSCSSPNAILSLSFSFLPRIYRPIQIKDLTVAYIHVWATFTPSIEKYENQIEIDLLQACLKTGYFYNLNNSHSWESVGYSSYDCVFHGQTGFTPIRTFFLERIDEKINFLIVNVENYSGVITLNFVAEQKMKEECFEDKFFLSLKNNKNDLIGKVKTVDIKVEKNKKYCAPVYLFYEEKMIKNSFEINQFQSFSTHNYKLKEDITDNLLSQIPFDSSIMEVAHYEIEYLKNIKLMKTFILPKNEPISLQKIFREFNIQPHFKLRIYIDGSTTCSNGGCTFTNFWKPFFKIFDKNTGHLCRDISQSLLKSPFLHVRNQFDKNRIPIDWHTFIDLDLDEIGIEKVVVLNIKCHSSLKLASTPGMICISRVVGDDETLLFRNPIFEDSDSSFCGIFMRFEFIQNEWFIVPMRYCFTKKRKLDLVSYALFKNKWILPQYAIDKINDQSLSCSSDDEFLLDEIETEKNESLNNLL